MFGLLNVYKPKGKTSHDVVAFLRRVTKIKCIGHTGTLDPFAEGVLPVCIGKATRIIEYLEDDKSYIGTIQLGCSTTTYDTEGEVVKENFEKKVTKDEVDFVLNDFRGEIEQIPPIYSAIKIKGKKLYEYARKGEEVKIPPRRVFINELKVLRYEPQLNQIELYISCSKGTYIRSLANDIGEKLGVYGHLIKLIRTKAGLFELDNAVHLEELNTPEKINEYLMNPLDYLNYPKYELTEFEKEKISHGMSIKIKSMPNKIVVLTYNKVLAAIGTCSEDGLFKCNKVFL